MCTLTQETGLYSYLIDLYDLGILQDIQLLFSMQVFPNIPVEISLLILGLNVVQIFKNRTELRDQY